MLRARRRVGWLLIDLQRTKAAIFRLAISAGLHRLALNIFHFIGFFFYVFFCLKFFGDN